MAPRNRTERRNIWFEYSSSPGTIQGGLAAATNLSATQLLHMIFVLFSAPGGFETRLDGSDTPLLPGDGAVPHGRYILTPNLPGAEMQMSDDRYYPRTFSISSTSCGDSFRRKVRYRDCRCVISGDINYEVDEDNWIGFEAAHIFPLALNEIFMQHGFSQLITYNDLPSVNSPQNGILLRSHIHREWDNYSIAINPNDGYRVQSFTPNTWRYHGAVLDPVCRQPNDPSGVLDVLLRWHFEQAVLCNVRGAGEPIFEFDFPPGSDMMGELQDAPYAAERMEAELFSRLHNRIAY